ncbi:LAMI_0C09824g1_1 [Lachancea mirantina]|uniref:LAMI_0C09824g1_1 n=1 Tax=Lachancea mirantina TaxID=1230905 RepID=A0A1G4J5C6_9SACH|nr:LAMI_0C09824g1_1 [Lachancea mirantina]
MTTKPKCLIPYCNRHDAADTIAEWRELETSMDLLKVRFNDPLDLEKYMRTSQFEALWVTEDIFVFLGGLERYYDHFPKTLRAIVVPWVGIDFIDKSKLKQEKNIVLCNIGPNASEYVSEIALHLTISCFRLTSFWEHTFRSVEQGSVSRCRDYIGGKLEGADKFPSKLDSEHAKSLNMAQDFVVGGKKVESSGQKHALVLGFGSIGQAIGKKLYNALDMTVHYYKRSGPMSAENLGYSAIFHDSLDDPETWHDADVIVLALPSSESTNDLINEETLALCKDGVRIVNVGRGSCVDEDALLKALDTGRVTSAGLDVYRNEETQIDGRFLNRWDVTLLPHIGSAVTDIIEKQTRVTLQNLESIFLKNEGGVYPVN